MSRTFWIVLALLAAGLLLLVANDGAGSTFGMDNDDFGRTLYLGALGAVIAAGILGSGVRLGYVARSLGLWALAILVLIAGYQYRYELQDVLSRVTAGLVPGSPLSVGLADGRATVTLEKRGDGHFQARVSINGATIPVIVDTGATTTVLTADDARRAGFDTAALNYSVPVSTANGTARAAQVRADEVSIGGISRRNLPLLVAQPGMLEQSLLGMNFIGSLSGFDMRGDRMTLRD